jgi:hypothetical protein
MTVASAVMKHSRAMVATVEGVTVVGDATATICLAAAALGVGVTVTVVALTPLETVAEAEATGETQAAILVAAVEQYVARRSR